MNSFVKEIHSLILHDNLISSVVNNAHNDVVKHYNSQVMAKNYELIYKGIKN